MQRRRILSTDRAMIDRFGDPFRPLEPDCRVLQFGQPLTAPQLKRAGRLIAERPDVELYVYGRASHDLDFLQYFKTLHRLHVSLYELDDIAGFSELPSDFKELTFGGTKKNFSLRFLEAMPHLKRLFLVRHRKDLPCIQDLKDLEDLGFSGITLPDLSVLLPLVKLRILNLFLGGTTNLGMLTQLPSLENLWLMRITKLFDLGVLADLIGLKKLRLVWMRNVTSIPSLHKLRGLDEVKLETMKGLNDLSSLATAPVLRRVFISNMPQLTADSFRCFVGHPHLEELWAYTGKKKVRAQIKQMFPNIAR